mmetsp:Transcript_17215/g.37058  ORF Transcript_17215/g.37058 Transcript_17215/m.37058 type:complete len:638 (-) Transcript_17215:402-2315(-)|eukprot:CAMPEP_0206451466 /NCGR_PEP_ID=MMETSP0324_2-20121206/19358_1 /ASSEMBLY_ACC=CAM_ASM_000836 /TAXON_ID=2866 /ORGANISM="Crypthecodinium cohnii, Strain Seligo" /LENGTH=637 /DNA_ID=CAMNT_0053921353 /DNA_START=75 /DNA_END=1988 /DNA_ORIENTATION=-
MAPPSKRAKTAPAPAGAVGSLQMMFKKQAQTKTEAAKEPPTEAPTEPPTAPTAPAAPAAAPVQDAQKGSALPASEEKEPCTPHKDANTSGDVPMPDRTPSAAADRATTPSSTTTAKTPGSGGGTTNSHSDNKAAQGEAKARGVARPFRFPRGGNKPDSATPSVIQEPAAAQAPALKTPEKTSPPQELKTPVARRPVGSSCIKASAIGNDACSEAGCKDWQEYTSLYAARLKALKPSVLDEAKAVWGSQLVPGAIQSEVSGYRKGSEVVVVGVIYKDLKTRPSVVKQFKENPLRSRLVSAETESGKAPEPESLTSDEDRLFIEDNTMRVKLDAAPALVASLVSGLVAAVKGSALPNGDLKVSGIVFSRLPSPPALLPQKQEQGSSGRYLAFISGLSGLLSNEEKRPLVEKLQNYLVEASQEGPNQLAELVICGNILGNITGATDASGRDLIAVADDLLAKFASVLPVMMLPGGEDPTNYGLPQRALHSWLLPSAKSSGSVKCIGNPCRGTIESSGLMFVGHGGQPVKDLLRCSRGKTPLAALQLCLEARHIAPTAPDTLATPPVEGNDPKDPFVLEQIPHLLVSGTHGVVEHRWLPSSSDDERVGTQLLCVPSLDSQPAVVLVNLSDPRDIRVHDLAA